MTFVFQKPVSIGRLLQRAVAFACLSLAGTGAQAQAPTPGASLFDASPQGSLIAPQLSPPGTSLLSPNAGFGTTRPPAPAQTAPIAAPLAAPTTTPAVLPPSLLVPAGQVALQLDARFGKGAPPITGGLTWRVYAAKADATGTYRVVREDRTASPTIVLPAGTYLVYAGLGLANTVKPVQLTGAPVHETFELPAGGLRMIGKVGDVAIPAGQISFDVYRGSQFEAGDRQPIAPHVLSGDTVMVPEGTYYIVSNYGDSNSTLRSDIRVQAGKLTDVTITHRAAVVTLKLVAEHGGEALANTAWTVLTPGGDVIKESIGAFPRVVLAEGEYRAIARNDGKVFERDFNVVTGVDGDIEVMARQ